MTLMSLTALWAMAPAIPCHASTLRDDAGRLESAWVRAAFSVTRMPARFLVSGDASPLGVPSVERQGDCMTVAVFGSRTTDFVLEIGGGASEELDKGDDKGEEEAIQSVAGALALVRCREARRDFERMSVRMKSPQAALEVLVAYGPEPAPAFDSVLPERAPGTTAKIQRPGMPPIVAPLTDRLASVMRRVRESGGFVEEPKDLHVNGDGAVWHRMILNAGCHRLVAMSRLRYGQHIRPSDTDMEVRTSNLVRSDRSFGTDAVVDLCLGAPDRAEVSIVGVPAHGLVSFFHGQWDIPEGIPRVWEPEARAALAQVLLNRRAPLLRNEPVWEALGAGGTTHMTVFLEPGSCYVLGVSTSAGNVRVIQISAQVGAHYAADNGGGGMEAGLVSFCAQNETIARLEVTAFGSRVQWVAGLWRIADFPLGTEALP